MSLPNNRMPQLQEGALHPIRFWSIILFVLGLCVLGWSQGAYTDKEALKYVGSLRSAASAPSPNSHDDSNRIGVGGS